MPNNYVHREGQYIDMLPIGIRALQGHSGYNKPDTANFGRISVTEEQAEVLYHGTSAEFAKAII